MPPTPTTRPTPADPGHAAPTRLPALDALRGIAILLVLAYHFAPEVPTERVLGNPVLSLLQIGWVGVDLFFVLSGFLITGILLDGAGRPGSLVRFYGRRALRILPLYYGTLAVLLLVALAMRAAGAATVAGETLLGDQAWYWLHAANLAAAREAQWAGQSWAQHFWSLAVEEQFYLVWPCVVLLLPRRWLPAAIGCLVGGALVLRVLLAVLGERAVAAYVLTPARADALAVGALLAVLWRTPAHHALVTRAATWLLAVTGLGLGALIATQGPGGHGLLMATVGHSYWALFFGAVLWLGVAAPAPGWLHRQRWLHWLARYSYGLYVVHFPLRQWLASEGLTATELAPRWGILGGGAMGLAIGVAASCAIAVPLWHWFERPILDRGGSWLERRLRTSRRPAESQPAVAGVVEA